MKKIDYTVNHSRIAQQQKRGHLSQDPCLSIVIIFHSVYIILCTIAVQMSLNHFLEKAGPIFPDYIIVVRGVLNTREMYTESKYLAAIQRP